MRFKVREFKLPNTMFSRDRAVVFLDLGIDHIMNRLVQACQTGQVGDGIVWKVNVDRAFFIAKNYPNPIS